MNAPLMPSNASQATERACEECRQPFAARKRWQRFCKPACRNTWHQKKAVPADERLAQLERRVKALEDLVTPAER